jgi:hypothetical protein
MNQETDVTDRNLTYSWNKDDPVLGGEFFILVSGQYAPTDLVEVYRINNPRHIISFQAHYLATGVHL